MIKLLTIIGARPQIIKAAAISRAIQNGFSDKITENMSQVFFSELGIPQPYLNARTALCINEVDFPKLYSNAHAAKFILDKISGFLRN